MGRRVQVYADITFTWRVSAQFMHPTTPDGPLKFNLRYEQRYVIYYVVNFTEEESYTNMFGFPTGVWIPRLCLK
jgi:hypothetical protein